MENIGKAIFSSIKKAITKKENKLNHGPPYSRAQEPVKKNRRSDDRRCLNDRRFMEDRRKDYISERDPGDEHIQGTDLASEIGE